MDERKLRDWQDFCEGRKGSPGRVGSIFKELYLQPLSDRDKEDLRAFCAHVPNSARLAEKMIRMGDRASDKKETEILEMIKADSEQMRQIVVHESVRRAIGGPIHFVRDEGIFRAACQSTTNGDFLGDVAQFMNKMIGGDEVLMALSDALYGIASSVRLQWSLVADALDINVSFGNYFELYLIGVDYAFERDRVVAIDYRAIRNSASDLGRG